MDKINYLDSDSISSFLKCPYCKNIFFHPITIIECMHSYCNKCFDKIIKDESDRKCKLCSSVINENSKFIKHNLVENCLNELFVLCPNEKQGCLWIETRDKLDSHIKICIFNNNEIFDSEKETEKEKII